jgi:hypothetical protein
MGYTGYGLWAMGSISFVDEMHRKNQGGEGPPISGLGIGQVQSNSTLPNSDTLIKKA